MQQLLVCEFEKRREKEIRRRNLSRMRAIHQSKALVVVVVKLLITSLQLPHAQAT